MFVSLSLSELEESETADEEPLNESEEDLLDESDSQHLLSVFFQSIGSLVCGRTHSKRECFNCPECFEETWRS
jgi:hypothetical protein